MLIVVYGAATPMPPLPPYAMPPPAFITRHLLPLRYELHLRHWLSIDISPPSWLLFIYISHYAITPRWYHLSRCWLRHYELTPLFDIYISYLPPLFASTDVTTHPELKIRHAADITRAIASFLRYEHYYCAIFIITPPHTPLYFHLLFSLTIAITMLILPCHADYFAIIYWYCHYITAYWCQLIDGYAACRHATILLRYAIDWLFELRPFITPLLLFMPIFDATLPPLRHYYAEYAIRYGWILLRHYAINILRHYYAIYTLPLILFQRHYALLATPSLLYAEPFSHTPQLPLATFSPLRHCIIDAHNIYCHTNIDTIYLDRWLFHFISHYYAAIFII